MVSELTIGSISQRYVLTDKVVVQDPIQDIKRGINACWMLFGISAQCNVRFRASDFHGLGDCLLGTQSRRMMNMSGTSALAASH